jgi:lipopolysaccharide biosynthesis protein
MINKIIVKWTQNNYRKENRFIFINAWNEWGEGSYLEPDDKYGYSSINSLSKALFNLSFIKTKNLTSFNNTSKILVQAHIHNLNLNLIKNIIKFTNNIPVKFDIFISLSKVPNKIFENYIKIKSKAFKFKFQVFPNEGNDILPFLLQVKNYIKKYKYCCHIYTKKLLYINFVNQFRNYFLNNLLENTNIIS